MSIDLSSPEKLRQDAIDVYNKYWNAIRMYDPGFSFFVRLKFGMVSFILYAPDTQYRKYYGDVYGEDPGHDGPGHAMFLGRKEWTKEEFLLRGQLHIMGPVCGVGDEVVMHENVFSHELMHIADWYSEMVKGPDFAHPHDIVEAGFYKVERRIG